MIKATIDFFTKNWGILVNFSISLVISISHFVISPSFDAHILQSKINYQNLSIFILTIILGGSLFFFYRYKAEKYSIRWVAASSILLILAVVVHFKYTGYYNSHTAWYEEAQEEVIVGDNLINIAQESIEDYKRQHNGRKPSIDTIVSSFNYPDGLWTRDELDKVYRNLVFFYLVQVLLFSLAAVFIVQSIYCKTNELKSG